MLTSAILLLACQVQQKASTFSSRSGELRLEVKDTGDGCFSLELGSSSKAQWSETVHHSIEQAFIAEDGTVVAHGVTRVEGAMRDQGFALTILGPEELTRTRMLEVHPYLGAITHSGPHPRVRGLYLWEPIDRCAFWIDDLGKPGQLWTYSLSSGARKSVIEPEAAVAEALWDNPELISMTRAVADGPNDLLLCTFWEEGPRPAQPGPGNYLGPDRSGIFAIFRGSGELIGLQALPEGRFCGEIRQLQGTKDDLRCELDVNRLEMVRRRKTPVLVEAMKLHFHRDGSGNWRQE